MEKFIVTQVEMPGKTSFEYGLFKVKGLQRTIFRFQYLDDGNVKVENEGTAFHLDSELGSAGREIKLKLTGDKVKRYEQEIAYLINNGMAGNIS